MAGVERGSRPLQGPGVHLQSLNDTGRQSNYDTMCLFEVFKSPGFP